ncbi:Hypothetical protein, putative F1-ATPase, gamma subunit [Metamycoplasma alkalescens 14918]|uniref:ATP synthase gamma chain n=1 Tax=Metamycoplasma alkalescens 14918 TaxID=1188234 RepID=N9UBG8_9BACT|nr:hypothetical protein [Metamycoplasma alkalescens]ENY54071.1 Hypothetical protein, putative F1-ATPase, gamma subunit [Metamycoplasma alkalescens 14918]
MHLKKYEEKLQNLNNILTKVNNSKNILLIDIMKLTRKLKFDISNALLNISLITKIKNQYTIKNKLLNADKKTAKKKQKNQTSLWIYVTEKQKYSTDSYSRYEKTILNSVNKKHDDFIVVGERALQFCKQNDLNVIKHFLESEEKNKSLPWIISQLIKILHVENNYDHVNFVINTNKNYNGYFTLLPIDQFDVNKLAHQEIEPNHLNNFANYKIYPGIEEFIDNEINIFLENTVRSLMIESSFYNAKNDLVTTNKIINQIEDEITIVKKKIIRSKREKEIEEIVLLTRANKNFFED